MAHRDVSSGSYSNREPAMAPKLPAKELDHIQVHQGEGGGHIIEHHFTHSYEHPPEKFPFGPKDGAEAMAHIAKHAKIKNEKPMQEMKEEESGEEEGGY